MVTDLTLRYAQTNLSIGITLKTKKTVPKVLALYKIFILNYFIKQINILLDVTENYNVQS